MGGIEQKIIDPALFLKFYESDSLTFHADVGLCGSGHL